MRNITLHVGTALIFAAMAAISATAAVGQVADDRDGDHVIDIRDNCLLVPNPLQRDTDGDGFGNACDPDFNQNGVVDDDDRELLGYHVAFPTEPVNADEVALKMLLDLDGNGRVGAGDLAILVATVGEAPGPVLDSDGDGLGDLADPCLTTGPGETTLLPGCSILDVVGEPGTVLDPSSQALERSLVEMADRPDLGTARQGLAAAVRAIAEAEALTRGGNPCGGDESLGEALNHIGRAQGSVASAAKAYLDSMPPPNNEGDARQTEIESQNLTALADEVSEMKAALAATRKGFSTLCERGEPFSMTGQVRRIMDGEGRIEIDEMVLSPSSELELKGDLSVGISGRVDGLHFGDGTGIISSAIFPDPGGPGTFESCLQLRFVPVQPMAPYFPGPYLKHDPRGYALNDKYMFERGMRFAVEDTCLGERPGPQTTFTRLSMVIEQEYTPRGDEIPISKKLAWDLEPGDTPVGLRWDTDLDQPVTVRTTQRVQTCRMDPEAPLVPIGEEPAGLECDSPRFITLETYELSARERGERCVAIYDRTEFAVNDQILSDWDQTWVTDLVTLSVWDENTEPFFMAEGYTLCDSGSGLEPCSSLGPVYQNHSFAIENHDSYPIHLAGTPPAWLRDVTGVDRAAGLRWPRVNGINQGYPWQFSCTLPNVVRDVVNFCEFRTNAYYRMPFAAGSTAWRQSQGNMSCDDCTHNGGYAYDMVAPCETEMRAARAGVVVRAVESNHSQMWEDCVTNSDCPEHICCAVDDFCDFNELRIRHQDGTIAQYIHFPQSGIVPKVGDIVRRGELIGFVGTTGNSSGPHLHFQTRNGPMTPSTLALFEAIHSETGDTMTCYEPRNYPDDGSHHYHLRSNNKVVP